MKQPLFILSTPRSFTSVACAMIGSHPEMFDLAELNLFCAETVGELQALHKDQEQLQFGLLRSLSEVAFNEQTDETVAAVQRWLAENLDLSTAELFRTIALWVGDRALVDKSPIYCQSSETLERILANFPDAFFLHLTRHPTDMLASADRVRVRRERVPLAARRILGAPLPGEPAPEVNPELMWLVPHQRILKLLARVPPDQQMRLRGEDLLADPARHTKSVAQWLGIRSDPEAIEAMLHPEYSPFARFGPASVPTGGAPDFMRSPKLRPYRFESHPLELRTASGEDFRFSDALIACATEFGY